MSKSLKKNILVSILFIVFLLGLPEILTIFSPCLETAIPKSYIYNECNIGMVLNQFTILALVGFSFTILLQLFLFGKKSLKLIAIFALIYSASIILSFYYYIPTLERKIGQAQIILEPDSF